MSAAEAITPTWPRADVNQIRRFLELLGKKKGSGRYRGVFPSGDPRKDGDKGRKGPGHQEHPLEMLEEWQAEGRGAYVVINDGGDSKKEIKACRALFCEWDDKPIEWQMAAWRELGLPEPTMQVSTGGKSIHCYWVLDKPISPADWEPLQKELIAHVGGDAQCKDACRVMRLPGTWYMHPGTNPGELVQIVQASGLRYAAAEIKACLPEVMPPSHARSLLQAERATTPGAVPLEELLPRDLERLAREGVSEGSRNADCFALAASALAHGDAARAAGLLVDGTAEGLVLAFASRCSPPMPQAEALQCLRSAESEKREPDPGWSERLRYQLNKQAKSQTPLAQQAVAPADEIWPDDETEEDELSPDCQLNLSEKLAEGRKIFTFESLLPAELAAAVELLQRPLPTDPLSAVLPLLCGYSGILKLGTRVSSSLSFEKPVNLYVACVMRTGGAKTSIKNTLVDNPAKGIRREMAKEHRRQMQEWESLDGKNRPDAPRPVFVHLSDYTPAALSLQLQRSEQVGLGQLIIRDELSALFASLTADAKRGTGTADSQLLEAFDGEGYTSIRVNEPPRSYDSCHVSVYGNIQPDVLKRLINDDDATGKFARFLFCRVPSRPLELVDDDPTDEEISRHRAAEAVLQDYAERLFRLPPRTYHFSQEARSRFHAWFREHNARAQVDGCSKVVSALLGKTSAHALRLAGILHLIHLVAGHVELRDPIGAPTVDMAMAIVDQLTQETEVFHEQEETTEMRLMRHIHQVSQFSRKPVSLQDARDEGGRAFREQLTAAVFRSCIEKLQVLGYGSVVKPGDTSRQRASRYLAIKEVA